MGNGDDFFGMAATFSRSEHVLTSTDWSCPTLRSLSDVGG